MKQERLEYKQLDYPEGSILVDVRYYPYPEKFEVIYLNPITGRLDVKYEEPLIDIWFLNEDKRTNKYQISQAEIKDCYKILCKPSQVSKTIASEIGGEWQEKFDQIKGYMSNNGIDKEMCKCPWSLKADLLPDVYFRLRWLKQFGRNADFSKATSAFLDIECDVIDKPIDMNDIRSETCVQPINAVTLILPHDKIVAVMLLGPRPDPKVGEHPSSRYLELLNNQKHDWEWLKNNQKEFIRMIKEDDEDNAKYINDFEVRLHLYEFKEEIHLIKTIFDYINKYRPMFCESWNAPFDHPYIWHRIEYLGYDPRDFFIPEGIETDKIYFSKDRNPKSSIKTSRDWFFTSTYTTYLCQERLYAAIRKSQSEKRSYSLSYTGRQVAGIDKSGNTKSGTFREFAYTDPILFWLYNVRDVVVQYAIELKTGDAKSLLSRSYQFATQFSKCFQETHIVRNIREYYYERVGFIQSNRLEVDPNFDTHFKGAFVAPTDKNAPTGNFLHGRNINNIIYAALDADAKAYYPSTKMFSNLDPMALLFKCIIDVNDFINGRCKNKSLNQQYFWYDNQSPPQPHAEDIAGFLMNSYKNGNEASVCQNYFNMPSITEMFEYIESVENRI